MAEVVFNETVAAEELSVISDSAGTGSWHVGQDMDRRAKFALLNSGYNPKRHRAKQFDPDFLNERELILALDREHLHDLRKIDKNYNHGRAYDKIVLLTDFDKESNSDFVPDPYYGDEGDFKYALSLIESAISGLMVSLKQLKLNKVRD